MDQLGWVGSGLIQSDHFRNLVCCIGYKTRNYLNQLVVPKHGVGWVRVIHSTIILSHHINWLTDIDPFTRSGLWRRGSSRFHWFRLWFRFLLSLSTLPWRLCRLWRLLWRFWRRRLWRRFCKFHTKESQAIIWIAEWGLSLGWGHTM